MIGLIAVVASSVPAAALPGLLCEAATETTVEAAVYTAATAVFPAKARSKSEECVYPLKLLRYGDADVLLTKTGAPGTNDCHACGAVLSAYVLRRTPDGPKPVASFLEFSGMGSFGQPGDIDAIQLDGHDAFAATVGSMAQGYISGTIAFFVFRNARLDEIKPPLPLYADNGGALDAEGDTPSEDKATSVDGAWHIDPLHPAMVTIDYRTKTQGKTRHGSATWRLEGNEFRLIDGRVPDEYAVAGGG